MLFTFFHGSDKQIQSYLACIPPEYQWNVEFDPLLNSDGHWQSGGHHPTLYTHLQATDMCIWKTINSFLLGSAALEWLALQVGPFQIVSSPWFCLAAGPANLSGTKELLLDSFGSYVLRSVGNVGGAIQPTPLHFGCKICDNPGKPYKKSRHLPSWRTNHQKLSIVGGEHGSFNGTWKGSMASDRHSHSSWFIMASY